MQPVIRIAHTPTAATRTIAVRRLMVAPLVGVDEPPPLGEMLRTEVAHRRGELCNGKIAVT